MEGDRLAAVRARVTRVRKELLPAAPVVLEERVAVASLARLRTGRLQPPRGAEKRVDAGGLVREADDVRALVRKDRDAELLVFEDELGPVRPAHSAGSVSRMYQFAVRPQSTVRLIPVTPEASSEAR